jgi:1-acyl-sn-glycerol-3-phosphate acyltransferase
MKANKLQAIWIAIRSIWITFLYLIKTSWNVNNGSRAGVDQVTRDWSEHLFKYVKLTYKVFNPHSVQVHPRQAYIVMSNHESLYDIPLVFVSMREGSIRMIAKKELFRIPYFGRILKKADFVFIDRQNTQSAIKALEKVKKNMEEGVIPWIAPEGTRSRDGALGKFKKGAFMLALQTNAIIIPMGIRGSRNVLPPKTIDFHLNQKVEIHIGEPIDSRQYSVETRDQLLKKVREQIEALGGFSQNTCKDSKVV